MKFTHSNERNPSDHFLCLVGISFFFYILHMSKEFSTSVRRIPVPGPEQEVPFLSLSTEVLLVVIATG